MKTKSIAFFDSKELMHHEYIPLGQTVNAMFYFSVLKWFVTRICHVRPEYREAGSWGRCTTMQSCIPHTLFSSILQKIKLQYIINHPTRQIWHHHLTFFISESQTGEEVNIFSGCKRDSGNGDEASQSDSYQQVRAQLRIIVTLFYGLYHTWRVLCWSLV